MKQTKSTKWAATVPVKTFTQKSLKKLHPTRQPDALAVAKLPSLAPGCLGRDRILILEEIRDSFNLGKILRCAEAFGITEVFCIMQDAAALWSVQSSMGASFCLKLSMMESAELA